MYTEGFEQWFKMNKNFVNPMGELGRASTEIYQHMMEQQLEIVGENFSRLSNQLQRLSSVKDPQSLLKVQKDCINEDVSAAIENTQKMIHIAMESMEEFTKVCQSTMREPAMNVAKTMEKESKHHRDRDDR